MHHFFPVILERSSASTCQEGSYIHQTALSTLLFIQLYNLGLFTGFSGEEFISSIEMKGNKVIGWSSLKQGVVHVMKAKIVIDSKNKARESINPAIDLREKIL